jgi:hypothetical protein
MTSTLTADSDPIDAETTLKVAALDALYLPVLFPEDSEEPTEVRIDAELKRALRRLTAPAPHAEGRSRPVVPGLVLAASHADWAELVVAARTVATLAARAAATTCSRELARAGAVAQAALRRMAVEGRRRAHTIRRAARRLAVEFAPRVLSRR